MNKKGFTLVELLAVIVILALLALVANSSVTNVVRNSKSDLYSAQIGLIESAAKSWGVENLDKIPVEGTCSYIKLKDLKVYGLLEEDVVNPKTNEKFSDDTYIKITSKINSEGVLKTTYEVDANNVSSCIEIYPPICKLVSGEENVVGSKYECEVKPDVKYNFYVLSHNEDETTNLIMAQNINGDGTLATKAISSASPENGIYNLVAWISKEDYMDDINYGENGKNNKGPVTAMNFLYNATSTWSNIPNIEINYNSEENTTEYGYGAIKTIDGITRITMKDGTLVPVLTSQEGYINLKARLPYYNEILNSNIPGEYLYDYLNHSLWAGEESIKPKNNIDGITGYWTISSGFTTDYGVWYVYSGGTMYGINANFADSIGVRPVITLEL